MALILLSIWCLNETRAFWEKYTPVPLPTSPSLPQEAVEERRGWGASRAGAGGGTRCMQRKTKQKRKLIFGKLEVPDFTAAVYINVHDI